MTKAFCPGHITCFFHPIRTSDVLSTGSRGAGIRLSLGATVTLEERSDRRVEVTMDGSPSEAKVTRRVLGLMRPGEGFDVTVENDLPVGQGFGMSAAGAIATAVAASGALTDDCFRYAHIAEVERGGGLGDVAALSCMGHQPVRVVPGCPPIGKVVDTGIRFDGLTLVVAGGTMDTGSVIGDPIRCALMDDIGRTAVDAHISSPLVDGLFSLSNEFSRTTGLETEVVSSILDTLGPHGLAAMCMLGNSVFTTVPADVVTDLLGDVPVFVCGSTGSMPRLI